jgi:XTP/dITP diphosphohydrolase
MLQRLVLATNNDHKVRELLELLDNANNIKLQRAADFPDVAGPEENGATFLENATAKAVHYAAATGLPALADDSGLVVDALGGRPGVTSARYAPTSAERNTKLLAEMAGVPDGKRSARFVCAMVLALPSGETEATEGVLEGAIGYEERGVQGFGYDPIFHVTELGCHLAEVASVQKNAISHRGKALRAMLPIIRARLGTTG